MNKFSCVLCRSCTSCKCRQHFRIDDFWSTCDKETSQETSHFVRWITRNTIVQKAQIDELHILFTAIGRNITQKSMPSGREIVDMSRKLPMQTIAQIHTQINNFVTGKVAIPPLWWFFMWPILASHGGHGTFVLWKSVASWNWYGMLLCCDCRLLFILSTLRVLLMFWRYWHFIV